jgi:PmbA protein
MRALREAVARCRADGVAISAWTFRVTDSRGTSLGIKDRQAGNAHYPLQTSDTRGAGYRIVWEDGLVSRGHLEREQLAAGADEAFRAARGAAHDDPDAAWVLGPADFPEVELHDPATARAATGEPGVAASRLSWIRRRIEQHGFGTWSGSFTATEARSRVLTSAGLDIGAEGTVSNWHIVVNGEIGDGFSARRPEPQERFEARLESLFRTAKQLEREADPMPGGVHPVLLHPRVVEAYVLETLLHNLGGASVFHGEGRFRREQFGSSRPVLREDLTLRIDPLRPMRRGSYRFTNDGLPASPCAFIEDGCLVRPVLDLKYARRLGLPPTPLPLALDTLFLEGPAPLTPDEAMGRAGDGALVLNVLGVHTQDRSSGDFSLAVPQALRFRNGRVTGRIRATLSGNLFDLLTDGELRFVRFEEDHTPGLLVGCRIDPK